VIKRKKTDVVQLKLRLVEDLRKRLEIAAESEKRSLNSEIIARLEESFHRAERASDELTERYRLNAERCFDLAETLKSSESKRLVLAMADGWLRLVAPAPDKEGPADARFSIAAALSARRAPRSGELNLAPQQAAMHLVAALGRPLRGNELDVAMEEPDSTLGRLLRAQLEKAAPPDNEPELPMQQAHKLLK
jgi:hypothetical protein